MLLYMTPLSPAAARKPYLHNRNRNTAVSTGGHTEKRLYRHAHVRAHALGISDPNQQGD